MRSNCGVFKIFLSQDGTMERFRVKDAKDSSRDPSESSLDTNVGAQ